MKTLTKYVLVYPSGDWQSMSDTVQWAKERLKFYRKHGRAAGWRLERWEFPILPDGTHGKPAKSVIA